MKQVFSYGGGVQSVALGRIILEGKFEAPDLVIFADTQQEPQAIYETVQREKKLFERAGIEFQIVTAGMLWLERGKRYPYYTLTPDHLMYADGTKGLSGRQCTQRFKIAPIQKYLKSIKATQDIFMWIGISMDEITRMKDSQISWITHRWPLIEMRLARKDLESYLQNLGLTPAKSACVFCPYKSKAAWLELEGADRDRAIAYDESIRDLHDGVKRYVHQACIPLEQVYTNKLQVDAQDNQDAECEGMCFV